MATKMASETETETTPLPRAESPQPQFSVEDFFQAVRYGATSHIAFILDQDASLVNKLDSEGFTSIHWAAKRGDYEVLSELQKRGADLDTPASFDSQMRPIHWAASDGKLRSVKFLLEHRQDVNALDGNSCTPLIIAAQYGRVEMVVYLSKNGADLGQQDVNGDTALHWGGYKGFEEVTGALMHICPQYRDLQDKFGQSPLHLAALRGNAEVVHYLIDKCGANTTTKDKNGCTPLMLAVKKEQLRTEWFIRRLTSKSTTDLVSNLGLKRMSKPQILTYLFIGCGDHEVTAWMWRISFVSNFLATYISIGFACSSVMADCGTLHMINTIVQCLWWLFFLLTLWKEPGIVPDEAAAVNANEGRGKGNLKHSVNGFHPHSYNAALEILGSDRAVDAAANSSIRLPSVCHTCHVQRPLRSKHCKVTRRCVCKFDHFCPWVYNTVGRDNYKYFVSIALLHPIAALLFMISSFTYWSRADVSYLFVAFLAYSAMMGCAISGLASYHLRLISKNMTTNEELNSYRYAYFRNEFNMTDNPFQKDSMLENMADAYFPSSKLYYTRDELKRDKLRGDVGEEEDDSEGYFEEGTSKLLQSP